MPKRGLVLHSRWPASKWLKAIRRRLKESLCYPPFAARLKTSPFKTLISLRAVTGKNYLRPGIPDLLACRRAAIACISLPMLDELIATCITR